MSVDETTVDSCRFVLHSFLICNYVCIIARSEEGKVEEGFYVASLGP